MLWVFAALMAAHWLEHAFQAWQVYVLGMPRPCALGMLGMRYPWLIRTESLHFGFAIFTTIGLLALWKVFTELPGDDLAGYAEHFGLHTSNPTAPWWRAATYISVWHLFEHTLLFGQAMLHHNLFGAAVPTSIIQLFVPRIELHLFYNSLVTIPIVVAMVLLGVKKRLSASFA
jgi:hypothetical protein